MQCPNCEKEVFSGQSFCNGCGKKLPFCLECDNEVSPEQRFCNSCGAELQPSDNLSRTTLEETGYYQPVEEGISGDLPICPSCRQTSLIWGTKPNPGWVWVLFVIGVLLIGLFGWILWGIAIYFLWIKPKPLIPHCPMCGVWHPEIV